MIHNSGILTLVALSAGYNSNDVPSVVHFRQSVNDYPFRNTSLPWKQRVDDLVSRLTLDEITQQVILGLALICYLEAEIQQ